MNVIDSEPAVSGNNSIPVLVIAYLVLHAVPMIISGIAIYLGYQLFILGVTGQASLSVNSSTVQGQLINAAPGLFFAIGGLVALIFTIVRGVTVTVGNEAGLGRRRTRPKKSHEDFMDTGIN